VLLLQVEAPPISDGDYLTAWHMLVLPVAAEFRPDLILVSAGFDAADKDPLGELPCCAQLCFYLWGMVEECFGLMP
jgi:acetoin utilization deacetylase AcuC-like enzyme